MTFYSKKYVVAALVGSAFLSSFAHAGLVLEQRPVDQPQQVAAAPAPQQAAPAPNAYPHRQRINLDGYVTPYISQSGEVPPVLPALKGAARSVSIMEALQQIIPMGWKVYSDGPLDENAKLSWNGGQNWVLVLNSVLAENQSKAFIDWTNKEVTLLPGAPVALVAAPAATAATRTSTATSSSGVPAGVQASSSSSPTLAPGEHTLSHAEVEGLLKKIGRTASSAPTVKPPTEKQGGIAQSSPASTEPSTVSEPAPMQTWTMQKGKMVSDNLDIWAKSIGWKLVWSAREGDKKFDYSSDPFIGYEFKGDLIGVSGVIARVISTFVDSDTPLHVEFFRTNKVIEVTVLKKNTMELTPEAH